MFEKYDVNDLFLAIIRVNKPGNDVFNINAGGVFFEKEIGYAYKTILRSEGNNFYDLQNKNRSVSMEQDPDFADFSILYLEQLSKYRTQDGKKKNTLSPKEAIKEASEHYNRFSNSYEQNRKR